MGLIATLFGLAKPLGHIGKAIIGHKAAQIGTRPRADYGRVTAIWGGISINQRRLV